MLIVFLLETNKTKATIKMENKDKQNQFKQIQTASLMTI